MPLPVIVGFGGFNAAGRSSSFRSYERLLCDLPDKARRRSVADELRTLTRRPDASDQDMFADSLMREIPASRIDTSNLPSWHKLPRKAQVSIRLDKKDLPNPLPQGWQILSEEGEQLEVSLENSQLRSYKSHRLPCTTAACLPCGFQPGALYPSRKHPLGLEIAIVAGSDALNDTGLDIDALLEMVPAGKVGVFAGSAVSQLDDTAVGGYTTARLMGGRASARGLAMGLPDTPGGFMAAYVLGSAGRLSHNAGACATFLFNLTYASELIKAGKLDLAVCGGIDAQVNAYYMEAFMATGAIQADQETLAAQIALGEDPNALDRRRACRPFGQGAGMAIGDAGHYAVLMSDRLALATGARILGSVGSAQTHSDGIKASISSPGVGNYFSFMRCLHDVDKLLGSKSLREHSLVLAHGTGTPLNRATESNLLSRCAEVFGISNWPVSALKGMLGHTMAAAGADQLSVGLAAMKKGNVPGIQSTRAPADNVNTKNLQFLFDSIEEDPERWDSVFINSKGFGGTNGTAAILSPKRTLDILSEQHGVTATAIEKNMEKAEERSAEYDLSANRGDYKLRYLYGKKSAEEADVQLTRDRIEISQGDGQKLSMQLQGDHEIYER